MPPPGTAFAAGSSLPPPNGFSEPKIAPSVPLFVAGLLAGALFPGAKGLFPAGGLLLAAGASLPGAKGLLPAGGLLIAGGVLLLPGAKGLLPAGGVLLAGGLLLVTGFAGIGLSLAKLANGSLSSTEGFGFVFETVTLEGLLLIPAMLLGAKGFSGLVDC